jgi:hypothetical protein
MELILLYLIADRTSKSNWVKISWTLFSAASYSSVPANCVCLRRSASAINSGYISVKLFKIVFNSVNSEEDKSFWPPASLSLKVLKVYKFYLAVFVVSWFISNIYKSIAWICSSIFFIYNLIYAWCS